MHKAQAQVREFHRAFDYPTSPAEPQLRIEKLRAALLLEETLETVVALVGSDVAADMMHEAFNHMVDKPRTAPDLVEAIDGICDVLYVTYGAAEAIGIDIEPFFDEVQRSNMAKVGGERRADGKTLKPPGWTPPDIEGVLAKRTLIDRQQFTYHGVHCPCGSIEAHEIWFAKQFGGAL